MSNRYLLLVIFALFAVANGFGLYQLGQPNPSDAAGAVQKQTLVVVILVADVVALALTGWPFLFFGTNPYPAVLNSDLRNRAAFIVGVIVMVFLAFAILAALGYLGASIVPVIVSIAFGAFLIVCIVAFFIALLT